MSGSSSSTNQSVRRDAENTKCRCGHERYERTSWTIDHPARRFWNCPYSPMTGVRKCNYFRWKDPELFDEYYKGVIFHLKEEVDHLESGEEMRWCRRRIKVLEGTVKELKKLGDDQMKVAEEEKSVLEMEVLQVRSENARLGRVLKIQKIVLMILVVGLGVSVLMNCFG